MFIKVINKLREIIWLNFGRPYVFQGECPACGQDHSDRVIRVKQDGTSLYAVCPVSKARIDLAVMEDDTEMVQ